MDFLYTLYHYDVMGGGGGGGWGEGREVSTKWRECTRTCVNKHVLMFSYTKTTLKHMFAQFYPHYIIMVA